MPKTDRRQPQVKQTINLPDPTAKPIEGKGDGFQATTLAEFLSLDEPTMRVIDLKISLVRAIRRLRADAKMTRAALAKKLGVSQPRVVEIESSKPSTTFGYPDHRILRRGWDRRRTRGDRSANRSVDELLTTGRPRDYSRMGRNGLDRYIRIVNNPGVAPRNRQEWPIEVAGPIVRVEQGGRHWKIRRRTFTPSPRSPRSPVPRGPS